MTNAEALDCVNFFCAWTCDLNLWPFDLEQLSYMAGHVANFTTKFEDHKAIRSWVTSYNGSHWLALKMRTRRLRMRRITWPVSKRSKIITFLESPTPICLFTIQLLLVSVMDVSSDRPMGASVARLVILVSGARSRSWNWASTACALVDLGHRLTG